LIVHHLRLFTFILVPILILTAVQLAAAKPADAPVIGPNQNAYRTIETYLNWHDARNYCSSLGGHLVTLNSQEENDFVYQLLDWGAGWAAQMNKAKAPGHTRCASSPSTTSPATAHTSTLVQGGKL
jgi:hypothetical protein